jgi:ATP-dependent RNA helicase DDX5/DBP2
MNSIFSISLRRLVNFECLQFRRFSAFENASVSACAIFRKDHDIKIKDMSVVNESNVNLSDAFHPIAQFDSSPFLPALKNILRNAGYESPTPIQAQSWPIALAKRDMISVAKTGSGKTCAYLLPAIHNLMIAESTPKVISLLVLAPTRELCIQIMDQVEKYTNSAQIRNRVKALACYGGSDRNVQIRTLRRGGINVLIATPGRCNDLIEAGVLNIKKVQYCVLDEADRMLDMGFEPQINDILNETDASVRQTLCFTATWPREVQTLAMNYLRAPVHINIGSSELLAANSSIAQRIKFVEERDKFDALKDLLSNIRSEYTSSIAALSKPSIKSSVSEPKVLIFSSRKADCDDIVYHLSTNGFSAVNSLHGDKSQSMRDRVLTAFRKGYCRYLVATDVAARGLDISVSFIFVFFSFFILG